MTADKSEVSAIESCDKSNHDMSDIFGHLDPHDFIQCSTPIHTDSFDNNSEVSDTCMHVDLHFSMISDSSLSSSNEAPPSKDLVEQKECDTDQLERKKDLSNLQLSIDTPFLPELELYGYSIVGDNIDKNVSPRNMTIDHQVLSLHYFHYYAVLDRVDFHDKSHIVTPVIKEKVDYEKFLPSPSDIMALKKNLAVIVSRILVENIPALQRFVFGIKKHIDHEWSKEMAKKSVAVSDNYATNVLV